MRKQSMILYVLGLLMVAAVALIVFLTVSVTSSSANSETTPEKPALDLPDDIPWDRIPWKEFPENFPWHEVPWEEMPENTEWESLPWTEVPWEKLPNDIPADKIPWESIPWEDLPEDFPYDGFDWENFPWDDVPLSELPWADVPWNSLPPDMPWTEIPWAEIPQDFPWDEVPLEDIPWGDVPWSSLPPDMPWSKVPWTEIPWKQMPEDFPWGSVPWEDLPEDFPWTGVGTDMCPHMYVGGENGDGWITTLEPTCSLDGTKSRVCILCRVPETQSIPATGIHIFQNDICTMCQRHHIVLESGSALAEYSGVPLKEESCRLVSGTLADHSHIITGVYAQTKTVGIRDNIFIATVTDASGADVTDLYLIDYEYGTLELTMRSVTVSTGSANKPYDGSALSCQDFETDGLAEGDEIYLTFTGSQTARGQSPNTATVKILDRDGDDVTANYSINIIFGILTVE